jgi:transcriptional regulator of acetoin/glycerol metabolism
MSGAAALLGVDRSTLYRQLARFGLRRKNTVSER